MYSQFRADFHHSHPENPVRAHDGYQRHGTDLIGHPIPFVSGQFSGQTIRAELREVQQADLGRKYARVDRRPLDPPPVVHLRLFEVYNTGTDKQLEKEIQNYEDVQVLGLLCTVDLFPIPNGTHGKRREHQRVQSLPGSFSYPAGSSSHHQTQVHHGFSPSHDERYSMERPFNENTTPSPTHASTSPSSTYISSPESPSDVVYHFGRFPITESSKKTSALVGATFVQPAIVEFQGKKSIMFVFADLAVKVEGTFLLRYRFFDIFSKPYNYNDLAIQAECYGGAFRVYSTKEFPGLQASTELTKQLARWGVRLNTRETERKRRKKGEARSVSPLYSSPGSKRKFPSSSGDSDDD